LFCAEIWEIEHGLGPETAELSTFTRPTASMCKYLGGNKIELKTVKGWQYELDAQRLKSPIGLAWRPVCQKFPIWPNRPQAPCFDLLGFRLEFHPPLREFCDPIQVLSLWVNFEKLFQNPGRFTSFLFCLIGNRNCHYSPKRIMSFYLFSKKIYEIEQLGAVAWVGPSLGSSWGSSG